MPITSVSEDAATIHDSAIIVDGHCDTPYRLKRLEQNIGDRDPRAQLDLETFRAGGITASFFAAYVPPYYATRNPAGYADQLIDIIHREVTAFPDRLMFVDDSTGIREAKRLGKSGVMIGIEGGHAIEDDLDKLDHFYDRGVRYMTLTHVNTNNWADSSGDAPRHGGLSPLGRDVVRKMNSLGMCVDISHVSDECFYHAIETTSVPLIASHSSCRALTNHPRNMTDQMLRDLAANGGICMINFFAAFINEGVARAMATAPKRSKSAPTSANEEFPGDRRDWDDYCAWFDEIGAPLATIDDVVDHIAHACEIAGVEHVGIGSDFDGVPALPQGLENAGKLPHLTQRMLDRGFRADEIRKIYGENFLRVFEQIERRERGSSLQARSV